MTLIAFIRSMMRFVAMISIKGLIVGHPTNDDTVCTVAAYQMISDFSYSLSYALKHIYLADVSSMINYCFSQKYFCTLWKKLYIYT